MSTQGAASPPLFPSPLGGFIAHVSWRPGEGWRLFVQAWHEDERPQDGYQSRYGRLTASECQDVLDAEVTRLCDWLPAQPSSTGGAGVAASPHASEPGAR